MNNINYSLLEAIANDPWKDGVPSAIGILQDSHKGKIDKDLENLLRITNLVKTIIDNPEGSDLIHRIIDKCFKYAENANTSVALKAFNICLKTLPAANKSKYGDFFTLNVGGKEFSLPKLLQKNSC